MKAAQLVLIVIGVFIGFALQPVFKEAKPPLSSIALILPGIGAILGLQVANLAFRVQQHPTCPECRGAVVAGARKCKNCGAWLVDPPKSIPAALENSKPCVDCGHVVALSHLSSTGKCKRCYKPFWAS